MQRLTHNLGQTFSWKSLWDNVNRSYQETAFNSKCKLGSCRTATTHTSCNGARLSTITPPVFWRPDQLEFTMPQRCLTAAHCPTRHWRSTSFQSATSNFIVCAHFPLHSSSSSSPPPHSCPLLRLLLLLLCARSPPPPPLMRRSCCGASPPPLLRRTSSSSSAAALLLSSSCWAGHFWPATNSFKMVGWTDGYSWRSKQLRRGPVASDRATMSFSMVGGSLLTQPPSIERDRHSWRKHKRRTPLQEWPSTMEQLRCVNHAFNSYEKPLQQLRAHTSLQEEFGDFNAPPAQRQSMPRSRTPNSRTPRCSSLPATEVGSEKLLWSSTASSSYKPRWCGFGVPPTPMTGTSLRSRVLAFPTHWQNGFRVRHRRDHQLRGTPPLRGTWTWHQGRLVPPSLWGASGPTREQRTLHRWHQHLDGVTRAIDHRWIWANATSLDGTRRAKNCWQNRQQNPHWRRSRDHTPWDWHRPSRRCHRYTIHHITNSITRALVMIFALSNFSEICSTIWIKT